MTDSPLAAFWKRLEPGPRSRLAQALGIPGTARGAALEKACADRKVLRSIEGISIVHREVLWRWVLTARSGKASVFLPSGLDEIDPLETQRAVRDLQGRGVVLEHNGRVEVLPPLAVEVREEALGWAIRRFRGPLERPPPAFFLALALGVVAADPPRITQGGDPHRTWERKVEKRFGPFFLGYPFGLGLQLLRTFGVLRDVGDPDDRTTLRVERDAIAPLFDTTPRDLAVASSLLMDPSGRPLQAMVRLAAACEGADPRGATIDEVLLAPPCRPARPWGGAPLAETAWEVVEDLAELHAFELVTVEDGPPLRMRPGEPAPAGRGSWVLQPNFEVLVGWDVPPRAVAELGLLADLLSVDRVCRLRLTATSVARGAALLRDPERVFQVLQGASSAPLPQNVRTTVAGWIEGSRPLLSHRGDVVVTSTDDHAALVRRVARDAEEIRPGVFLLPSGGLAQVLSAARRAGVPLAPACPAQTGRRGLAEWEHVMAAAGFRPSRGPRGIGPALEEARRVLRAAEAARRAPPSTPSPRDGEDSVDVLLENGRVVRMSRAEVEAHLVRRRGPRDDEEDDALDDDEFDDDLDEDDEDDEESPVLRLPKDLGGSRPRGAEPGVWEHLLPGLLHQRLEEAIVAAKPIRLLYVNSRNEMHEHGGVPLRIEAARSGPVLVIREANGAEGRFLLDRMSAVRT